MFRTATARRKSRTPDFRVQSVLTCLRANKKTVIPVAFLRVNRHRKGLSLLKSINACVFTTGDRKRGDRQNSTATANPADTKAIACFQEE